MGFLAVSANNTFLDAGGAPDVKNVSYVFAMDPAVEPGVDMADGGGSCSGNWNEDYHVLYQVAQTVLLISFLAPNVTFGFLFLHSALVIGFLLMSCWSWAVLCAPDMFSWNFSFMMINAFQTFLIIYRLRPVKFTPELEDVYNALFLPLKVPKTTFKKLVSQEYSCVLTLHQGEAYATQAVTKTDRLGLLIAGTAHVTCNGQFLHYILDKQFLDSPEFESTTHGDEKFHVSIVAAMPCRYLYWQRQALEYLFAKEPYLGTVMSHILGRDITNKLYLLNEKASLFDLQLKIQQGSRVDIRLPNVSSATLSGVDLSSQQQGSGTRQQLPNMADEGPRSDTEQESDYYEDAVNEKSTLMFANGAPHSRLQLQLSNSTYSSVSSR